MTIGVSAILTTYQRPELARRALKSILAQTLAPTEIIVVEDSGDTDLRDWIAGIGRNDVRYVCHAENKGLAAARNTGLRHAESELIAFLDDDDEWLPARLQEQLDRFRSLDPEQIQNLAAIQVGCEIVDSRGRTVGASLPRNQGNLRDSIMSEGAATPSSSFLFVCSALREIGGFDEKLVSGIDHDIWMKLAVAGYSNEIIKKPLVRVIRDDRPTMMSSTKRRVAGISQFVEKWTPTYQEWYGEVTGVIYAKKYFINVIAGLAGQKYAQGQFREGLFAAKMAFRYAKWRPYLLLLATGRLLRTFISFAIPQLRTAKRSILREQNA